MTDTKVVDEEQGRREALRKKGQEFLERAVAQANKGKDPQLSTSSSSKTHTSHGHVDPALETVGVMVEGLRLYIAALLFVVSSAASLVLAKATLAYYTTPAAVVFLHMLTAVSLLFILSSLGGIQLGPFSSRTLKLCLPEVVCSGLQMLCLFGLLFRESVYLVAIWTCLAHQVLQVALGKLTGTKRPRALQLLLMVLGITLAVGGLYYGLTGGLVSICLLTLWAVADVGSNIAHRTAHHQRLPAATPMDDPPNKATVALYKNAIAAVPVLALGFVFNEGSALARLEPTVPALSMLCCSCIAWSVASCTQLVVQLYTNPGFQLLMMSLSYVGILVAQVAVAGVGSLTMLLIALVAVIVSICMLWAQASNT